MGKNRHCEVIAKHYDEKREKVGILDGEMGRVVDEVYHPKGYFCTFTPFMYGVMSDGQPGYVSRVFVFDPESEVSYVAMIFIFEDEAKEIVDGISLSNIGRGLGAIYAKVIQMWILFIQDYSTPLALDSFLECNKIYCATGKIFAREGE